MVETITFVGMIGLSIVTIFFGFYCRSYSIKENKNFLNLRAWGLLLLGIGFVLHTSGDYLSPVYGPVFELGLESSAHVIILVSFILFIYSAREVFKNAKEYWLN